MKSLALFVGTVSLAAFAESYTWNPTSLIDTSCLWQAPENWTPSTSLAGPAAEDSITISGADEKAVTLGEDADVGDIFIDNSKTTLDLAGKHLDYGVLKIGCGNVYQGPVHFVISNGVSNSTKAFSFPDSEVSAGSVFELNNTRMTNSANIKVGYSTTASKGIAGNTLKIVNGGKFYNMMPDGPSGKISEGFLIASGNSMIVSGNNSIAYFNLKLRKFSINEGSSVIVEDGGKVELGPGSTYTMFSGPGGSIVVDGQNSSWTQTSSSKFNIDRLCQVQIKNNGKFKTNRLDFSGTNSVLEVLSGGTFEYTNYGVIVGYGGHHFKIDGNGSKMSINLYGSVHWRFASPSNRFDVVNRGFLEVKTNPSNGTQTREFNVGYGAIENILSFDNATGWFNNPRAYIGYNGCSNVLSMANSSTLTLKQPCRFTFGAGDKSYGNKFIVKGSNNKINIISGSDTYGFGTSGLVMSNATEMAFIVTADVTPEKPMLTITCAVGEIDFRGITKSTIDPTEYLEAGNKEEITLLKVRTSFLNPGSLTDVLKAAVSNKGRITCTSDENYTYWKYKSVKPGLTLIIQ